MENSPRPTNIIRNRPRSDIFTFGIILTLLSTLLLAPSAFSANPSYTHNPAVDTMPFYPNASYDQLIPKPDEHMRHAIGSWPLRYHELVSYIKLIANSSDRVVLETHGRTHEGRDLFNVFISSPDNIGRLEEHRQTMARLADPSQASAAEAKSIAETLPAFAWIGYSIHGDEISGVDAGVQLIYHLAAAQDSATLHLLDNVIIIVDPIENPDGRERYLSMLQTYQSFVPNYDRHAMQHGGVWPWGRGNHYLFDLNRDWVLLTQPETLGRLRTILKFNPLVVVDAHEMGSSDNFLFTPPREPINHNTPANVRKWWKLFSRDQASAFDERRWPYYVGEWHEQWYPGYGSAWSSFFGAVAILYEQAGVDGSSIKQPDDYLLTYHEAVNHQFTSSITNLFTTANNRRALLIDYNSTRRSIVERGQKSGLQYLFVPDKDRLKMKRFIESLTGQGIEVHRAEQSFSLDATDAYGEKHSAVKFPVGTFIVNTAQPMGGLANAVLEFDPRLKLDFLKEERRELEKHDNTRMYEVSTWNLPLAYDLDAYWTTSKVKVASEKVTTVDAGSGQLHNADASFGFVINMEGEKTFRLLNKIYQRRLQVYGSTRPFTIEGREFESGSLVLRRRNNPADLVQTLTQLADEEGIDIYGVNTASSSEGSFLGASTFKLLKEPRIALLTGDPLSFTTFGALWFAIDRELEIPHSLIRLGALPSTNLDKYNLLIVPPAWGSLSSVIGKSATKKIDSWITNGGSLICVGNAAAWAADSSSGLSQVRIKRQALDKLDKYSLALKREIQAEAPEVDTMALFHPEKVKKTEVEDKEKSPLEEKELKEIDQWQRKFSPDGVILRVDIDREDWLSFGMKKSVPAMTGGSFAFLAGKPVTTTARFAEQDSLRLSGLLWPEARERWAQTAYLTHESKGKGQIILFAQNPNLRGYFYGTRKMFINAVLFGPGMGSSGE